MNTAIDPAAVRRFRCFQGLADADLDAALTHVEAVPLRAGETLFRQGDPGDALYLVLSGAVDIQVGVPGQPERTLSTLEAGAIFGEMSLLMHSPRTATARARAASEVLRISDAEFQAAVDRAEAWACRFLHATAQSLAGRLSALDQELVTLITDAAQESARPQPARVAELEHLRDRLFSEWSF